MNSEKHLPKLRAIPFKNSRALKSSFDLHRPMKKSLMGHSRNGTETSMPRIRLSDSISIFKTDRQHSSRGSLDNLKKERRPQVTKTNFKSSFLVSEPSISTKQETRKSKLSERILSQKKLPVPPSIEKAL